MSLPALPAARPAPCSIPLSEPFGFGERGHISIVLENVLIFRRHDAAAQDINADNFGMWVPALPGCGSP